MFDPLDPLRVLLFSVVVVVLVAVEVAEAVAEDDNKSLFWSNLLSLQLDNWTLCMSEYFKTNIG